MIYAIADINGYANILMYDESEFQNNSLNPIELSEEQQLGIDLLVKYEKFTRTKNKRMLNTGVSMNKIEKLLITMTYCDWLVYDKGLQKHINTVFDTDYMFEPCYHCEFFFAKVKDVIAIAPTKYWDKHRKLKKRVLLAEKILINRLIFDYDLCFLDDFILQSFDDENSLNDVIDELKNLGMIYNKELERVLKNYKPKKLPVKEGY